MPQWQVLAGVTRQRQGSTVVKVPAQAESPERLNVYVLRINGGKCSSSYTKNIFLLKNIQHISKKEYQIHTEFDIKNTS